MFHMEPQVLPSAIIQLRAGIACDTFGGMTVAEARRALGSKYRISQLLGVAESTVGRWGRMIPEKYRPAIQAAIDAGVTFPDLRCGPRKKRPTQDAAA